MSITANTEIRRLHEGIRQELANILDINDGWRKLARTLTQSATDTRPLYTNDEMTRFGISRTSPTLLLLDDWGTRGRVRPTVGLFLDMLVKANLIRAADYLAVNVLNEPPPRRPLSGLGVDTEDGELPNPVPPARDPPPDLPSTEHNNLNIAVPHILYRDLHNATSGFSGNYKLGQGGFGAVYLGHIELNGRRQNVAVKKLNMGEDEQFQTELRAMARYRHENLLQILGFSCDNPGGKCLVCAYMPNGSLEERLAKRNGTSPLPWDMRLNIAIGTARGLVVLHTMFEPLVHRDIKSANILLNANFTAKIGDFGIARMGSNWEDTTKALTSRWCGTPVYMADEALRGSITVKMDTFSYGVVLFELITGLAPYDINRTEFSLIVYVEEEEREPLEWKDPEAGAWPDSVVEKLFQIATRCTERKKKPRPLMQEVLVELEVLIE